MARLCGCDGKPADKPVYEEIVHGKTIRYFNCPTKFIPKCVYQWYQIYSMCAKPKITDLPKMKSIYIKFCSVYEGYISECNLEIEKRRNRK